MSNVRVKIAWPHESLAPMLHKHTYTHRERERERESERERERERERGRGREKREGDGGERGLFVTIISTDDSKSMHV
jgi:hypothetical protein